MSNNECPAKIKALTTVNIHIVVVSVMKPYSLVSAYCRKGELMGPCFHLPSLESSLRNKASELYS